MPSDVVDELGLAVLGVDGPAAEAAALGDDHTLGAAVGDVHLGGDRERLVLDADHAVLRQSSHAGEEQLRVAADQGRSARPSSGSSRSAPRSSIGSTLYLVASISQSRCSLASMLGMLGGEVVGLAVVGAAVVELPDVVVERREVAADHHPRRAVLGDRAPALVVDAAVAEHLEVLQVVALRLRPPR